MGIKTWVERLIVEYSDGKRVLESYRSSLDLDCQELKNESELVGGMISSLSFGITYMRSGRLPGSRRGVEHQSVYQLTELMDMDLFPTQAADPAGSLSNDQKRKVVDVLLKLSPRERQCYILHVAYGLSYAEIALEMKVSKASVQKFVERAKVKTGFKIET